MFDTFRFPFMENDFHKFHGVANREKYLNLKYFMIDNYSNIIGGGGE